MPRVLVVEDNEVNRAMIVRRLSKRGFDIATAGDGAQALVAAKSERPDLILMDMSLPVMHGWDATRALKADPQTSGIPVIALTAHAMSGDREKALEAGCDDFDTKPYNLPRLLEKMEALLGRASDA